jgi:hypothetical protein
MLLLDIVKIAKKYFGSPTKEKQSCKGVTIEKYQEMS